jgi:hypothetical protein
MGFVIGPFTAAIVMVSRQIFSASGPRLNDGATTDAFIDPLAMTCIGQSFLT